MDLTFSANFVDIFSKTISEASITVTEGRIGSITVLSPEINRTLPFILPGFVDAHVHIESSMLVPSEFARLAVVHGTVATVSDPHEIANVCGLAGVEFMLENGKTVPFKFNFGAPSCVPATSFETAGAELNAAEVEELLGREEIRYLSEMMNFPGVLNRDPDVMKKIAAARKAGKPVDGHAPGLRGAAAAQYIAEGISTDHECFTYEEALEKLQLGMHILIREGSAAKNFDALADLLHEYPDRIMFCSDDKHPDSLVAGHINELCERALLKGIPLFNILRAACVNPVLHYQLDVGLLRVGDPADFIVVADLEKFAVLSTFINGTRVAENGISKIRHQLSVPINQFNCLPKRAADFSIAATSSGATEATVPVIEAVNGQLITNKLWKTIPVRGGYVVPDVENDVLKIAVVNRYQERPVSVAFIHRFGLRGGAIASSVAHDSHNIVVVGTDDDSLARAVNLVITQEGGISVAGATGEHVLALPVAGLMSPNDGYEVANAYTALDLQAKALGSSLDSPFMTLSFMALLVIPELKISDKGLFDGTSFSFIDPIG